MTDWTKPPPLDCSNEALMVWLERQNAALKAENKRLRDHLRSFGPSYLVCDTYDGTLAGEANDRGE